MFRKPLLSLLAFVCLAAVSFIGCSELNNVIPQSKKTEELSKNKSLASSSEVARSIILPDKFVTGIADDGKTQYTVRYYNEKDGALLFGNQERNAKRIGVQSESEPKIATQYKGVGDCWAGLNVTGIGYNGNGVNPSSVEQNSTSSPSVNGIIQYVQGCNGGPSLFRQVTLQVYIDGLYYTAVSANFNHAAGPNYAGFSIALPTNLSIGTHNVNVRVYDPSGLYVGGYNDDAVWYSIALAQYTITQPVVNFNVSRSGEDCISWNSAPGASYYLMSIEWIDRDSRATLYSTTYSPIYGNQLCNIPSAYSPSGGVIRVSVDMVAYNSQGVVVGTGHTSFNQ